jgi:hypothetical protein
MSADFCPAVHPARIPWNKGRIIGQKRRLLQRHVWSIRVRLEMAGNARDLARLNMAVDSKLRGHDCRPTGPRCFCRWACQETRLDGSEQAGPLRNHRNTRLSRERWIRDPEMLGLDVLWPSRIHTARICRRDNMPRLSEDGLRQSA